MPKKCTLKAQSPATQQPQKLQAAERIKRLTTLLKQIADRFEADDRSQEVLTAAAGYWIGWPYFLNVLETSENEAASDEYQRAQHRGQLRQTHTELTLYLMREAVRRKLPPSPLWEPSRYCRELMLRDRIALDIWPDVLGERRYELPSVLQQAITDGESCFAHLMTVLDIDIQATKSRTADKAWVRGRCPPGQAGEWIRDYLCLHHKYDGEGIDNWLPLGVAEIARQLDSKVAPATVSTWFKKHFGSHAEYVGACGRQKNGPLLTKLRSLREEKTTAFVDPDRWLESVTTPPEA